MTPYQQLEARFARRGTLQEALAVLSWDHSAMMPTGGAGARAEQVSMLEVMAHEILTAAELPDLFEEAQGQNDLGDWQRANLKEMRRDWLHATAVPARLVEALRGSAACGGAEAERGRQEQASRRFLHRAIRYHPAEASATVRRCAHERGTGRM